MIGSILGLAKAGLSLWGDKNAVKYQKKFKKLEEERDEILEEEPVDRNRLDRVDRSIVRLGDLVATEIRRS